MRRKPPPNVEQYQLVAVIVSMHLDELSASSKRLSNNDSLLYKKQVETFSAWIRQKASLEEAWIFVKNTRNIFEAVKSLSKPALLSLSKACSDLALCVLIIRLLDSYVFTLLKANTRYTTSLGLLKVHVGHSWAGFRQDAVTGVMAYRFHGVTSLTHFWGTPQQSSEVVPTLYRIANNIAYRKLLASGANPRALKHTSLPTHVTPVDNCFIEFSWVYLHGVGENKMCGEFIPCTESFNLISWGYAGSTTEGFSFGLIVGGHVDDNISIWPKSLIRNHCQFFLEGKGDPREGLGHACQGLAQRPSCNHFGAGITSTQSGFGMHPRVPRLS
ncbi:hypothetical protein Sjap_008387 [Stephania japonica]|uniref:Uncharacterized protein n=1 Tax=Stephania japonica TaxID=461633 RepID=A0AAP0JQZ9_9MAGN